MKDILNKFSELSTSSVNENSKTQTKIINESKTSNSNSLKDIFNSMVVESNQITIQPKQQSTQVVKQGDKTIGTVTNPGVANQLKQAIEKGELDLAADDELDLNEAENDKNSANELRKKARVDGSIDGNDVLVVKDKNQETYLLVVDNEVSAFMVFEDGKLTNIKNLTAQTGVIRALVGYLVHKKKKEIHVDKEQPITFSTGLKWLRKIIKNPRGLKILDHEGNPFDINEIKSTSIIITENSMRKNNLNEKAVSKAQQQAAGIALSAKKGETPKSKLKGAAKEMEKMSKKELEKFAGTKQKGLPEKKDKKKLKESTNTVEAARLAGKSNALAQELFNCKYEQGSEESTAYLAGYKEGLDELCGSTVEDTSVDYTTDLTSDSMVTDYADEVDLDVEEDDFGFNDFETYDDDSFDTFSYEPSEDDMITFESWDRELTALLEAESTETKTPVKEGISVSVSKGVSGMPDSVSVTAQDAEATALLDMIKNSGIGLFGEETTTSDYGVPSTQDSSQQNGQMSSMLQRMIAVDVPVDDEEHVHGHPDAACQACGEATCECDGFQDNREVVVGEEETQDQEEFEVAESDEEVDEEVTCGECGHAGHECVCDIENTDKLDEWANDPGKDSSEDTFEQDIDFMTKVISGGINSQKRDQTTLPHTKVSVDQLEKDELKSELKRLSGIK